MNFDVVVDTAGAHVGGAAKFSGEMMKFLERRPRPDVAVIGRGRSLTPSWLMRRETLSRSSVTRIALNNASFTAPGGKRVVLLRNALHFATPAEFDELRFKPGGVLRTQAHVVRALTRRADVVVVPCTDMAERVVRHIPSVARRLVVRMHPVSNELRGSLASESEKRILLPIINAPYKNLQEHLTRLLDSLATIQDVETRITVTARRSEFAGIVAQSDRIDFVGALPEALLKEHWNMTTAVYYPTRLESFGYPLAECRVAGVPVIAVGSPQSREIAGPALCPIEGNSVAALARAVEHALSTSVEPEPGPFDPDDYFSWLFGPLSH